MRSLFVILTVIPAIAFAQNWKLVTDSESGNRLLVDVDSVKVEKYQKSVGTGNKIYANMSMISDGQQTIFTSVIDSDDCLVQRGGSLIVIYQDKTANKYFWSMNGTKMYDAQGQWLCGLLEFSIEDYKNKKQKSKTSL